MDNLTAKRLKKGLSTIKKSINSHIKFPRPGGVWKLKKPEVIEKITNLGYTYNEDKKELTTNSMIRKKTRIKL